MPIYKIKYVLKENILADGTMLRVTKTGDNQQLGPDSGRVRLF